MGEAHFPPTPSSPFRFETSLGPLRQRLQAYIRIRLRDSSRQVARLYRLSPARLAEPFCGSRLTVAVVSGCAYEPPPGEGLGVFARGLWGCIRRALQRLERESDSNVAAACWLSLAILVARRLPRVGSAWSASCATSQRKFVPRYL